jgi:uncharacterized phage-like protein YoqJ
MNFKNNCSFTGHRADKLSWKDETSKQAENFKMQLCIEIAHKIKAGCNTFYTGMCNGVDIIAGEMILELKETFPHIKLIAVIPYEDFASSWSEEWRERYFDLLAKVDDEILLNHKYKPNCFKQRNEYLVKHAGHLIAVHNNGDYKSGTYQTINMANRRNRSIVTIEPNSLETKRIESKSKFTLLNK